MSPHGRFSPERLALALLLLLGAAVLLVGIAIPAGFLLEKWGMIESPDMNAAWSPPTPVAPPGVPTLAPALPPSAVGGVPIVDIDFGRDGELFVLRGNGTVERLHVDTGAVGATGACLATASRVHWIHAADAVVVTSPQSVEQLDGRTLAKARPDMAVAIDAVFAEVPDVDVVTPDGAWRVVRTFSGIEAASIEDPDVPVRTFGKDAGWNYSCVYLGNDRMLFSWPPASQQDYTRPEHLDTVVDLRSGDTISEWKRSGTPCPVAMEMDSDGEHVLKLSYSGIDRLDPETGTVVAVSPISVGEPAIAVSPGGQLLCQMGGLVQRTSDQATVGFIQTNYGVATKFEFSPDGKWLARATGDGQLALFDVSALAKPRIADSGSATGAESAGEPASEPPANADFRADSEAPSAPSQ